jgi:hypothetical protein
MSARYILTKDGDDYILEITYPSNLSYIFEIRFDRLAKKKLKLLKYNNTILLQNLNDPGESIPQINLENFVNNTNEIIEKDGILLKNIFVNKVAESTPQINLEPVTPTNNLLNIEPVSLNSSIGMQSESKCTINLDNNDVIIDLDPLMKPFYDLLQSRYHKNAFTLLIGNNHYKLENAENYIINLPTTSNIEYIIETSIIIFQKINSKPIIRFEPKQRNRNIIKTIISNHKDLLDEEPADDIKKFD